MASKKSFPHGKARRAPARKTPARGARSPKAQPGGQTDNSLMKTWPRIVARAWSDPAFLTRLKKEPVEVFKEYNLPLIPDFEYAVKAGKGNPVVTLSVPPKPRGAHLAKDPAGDASRHQKTCTNTCVF